MGAVLARALLWVAALVASAALVAPRPARALDAWTTSDTAFELTGAVFYLADWSQTLSTVGPDASRSDGNVLLGSHPTRLGVDAYFAATLAGHAAVARILPQPYRRVWQVGWIGVEGTCVAHNL